MKKHHQLVIISIIVVLSQIILATIIYTNFETWPDRGTFGDMFGAINTLFSGLAFAGIIYAIFLQSKELELQREELCLTRSEMIKSAEAQSNQVKLMVQGAKLSALSSKLDTYTSLSTNEKLLPGMVGKPEQHIQEIITTIDELIHDINQQFIN